MLEFTKGMFDNSTNQFDSYERVRGMCGQVRCD